MGVDLSDLVKKHPTSFQELKGKWIAIDAYNTLYQFLASIRQEDGTPLKDFKGRITAHLSGLFYRNAKLLGNGIKIAYVFDGKPHRFKKEEQEERKAHREEAELKWKKALEREEEGAKKYAQAALKLTQEMVEESKALLKAMGVPVIEAPSDGEAQAAVMCAKGAVYAVASQDYDAFLYGAPRVVRNLSITGRRKVPRQNRYILVEPEIIYLKETLEEIGINREQLVYLGILIGTDFNKGVKGIGPKTALKLVKQYPPKELIEYVEEKYNHTFEHNPHEIAAIFLDPPFKEVGKLKEREIEESEVMRILVKEHDFSEERVKHTLEELEKKLSEIRSQSTLESWL